MQAQQNENMSGTVRETAHLTVSNTDSISNNRGNSAPLAPGHASSSTPGNRTLGLGLRPVANTPETPNEPENGRRARSNDQGIQLPRHSKKRNSLRLGTLNLRGLTGANHKQKLNEVAKLMKWNKWGILALQETHQASQKALEMELHNQNVYCITNDGPPNARGTMFMINRKLWPLEVAKDEIQHVVLLQGRAHLIKIKWDDARTLTIVNVYAPNDKTEFVGFLHALTRLVKEHNPDIVLGDFNHCEFAIDRIPQRNASEMIKNIIGHFKDELNLTDGFREAYPNVRSYTWFANHPNREGVQPRSRLDRIYCKPVMAGRCFDWQHETSQGLSDHQIALVDIASSDEPDHGPGTWRLSTEQIDDPECFEMIKKITRKAQDTMKKPNADILDAWFKAKAKIQNVCKENRIHRQAQRDKTLKAWNEELETIKTDVALSGDKVKLARMMTLVVKIQDETERITEARTETIRTRYAAKGETVSKYWLSMQKYRKMETMLKTLVRDDGSETRDTIQMAKIATDHHGSLQTAPPMTRERQVAIAGMRQLAYNAQMDERSAEKMEAPINRLEIRRAIRKVQTGRAPGHDGITYELYKKLLEIEDVKEEDDDQTPEITEILEKVFNKVASMKGAPAEYVKGIMFFLYKKGDKRLIKNYRPITLLNSDYKLQTKILATRLGEATQKVIHNDQAGFVPGRDILDHVKLAGIVTEYCEVAEVNGCIIALDQEKAYDRIDHTYLYEILQAYGLPEGFIEHVKSLYLNAATTTMVNGFCPHPFSVKRGVRQGDPLSCLLFNLAIEPLAESLRTSGLKGINIPGATQSLICKLFADDTLVYLSEKDKLRKLNPILNKWCLASTAKFNEEKTEYLPVGTPEYREKVVNTRSLHNTRNPLERIPDGTRILGEGDAMRTLGGWIGYNIDQEAIWEPKIKKMEATAKSWSKSILTLKGRKIIVNTLILSQAQYLMMVNRPPKSVIARVEKLVHGFFWRDKRAGAVRRDILHRDVSEGGLRLPSFTHRVETSVLMWVKKWRRPFIDRPFWTEVADRLLYLTSDKSTVMEVRTGFGKGMINPVDQLWWAPKRGHNPLSKTTMELFKAPEKYGVIVDAPKVARSKMKEQPFWLNKTVSVDPGYEVMNNQAVTWLKQYHNVFRMKDALTVKKGRCPHHGDCRKVINTWKANLKPKWNPALQTPGGDLDHTPNRILANSMKNRLIDAILINPDVTHRESSRLATRVFAFGKPSVYPGLKFDGQSEGDIIEIFTDGSADKNGLPTSRCGAGGWSEKQEFCFSIRVRGEPQSNNRGEVAAVLKAMQLAYVNVPVLIRTDSMYVIYGLTGGHVEWEDMNWLGIKNDDIWRALLMTIRRRSAETWIQKVEAHSGIYGNEQADELAKAALEKRDFDELDLRVDERWFAKGARLSTMTFRNMYRWVRELNGKPFSISVKQNLDRVRDDMEGIMQDRHYDERIWISLWKEPMRREVSSFLWQALHGRTVVGPYFKHWGPEWEERQWCECRELETLEHILKGCYKRPWVYEIWRVLGEAFLDSEVKGYDKDMTKKYVDHPPLPPPYGVVLGINLYKSKNKAEERLVKILVSETAFVIWKCRNALRVREETMTTQKAVASWTHHIFRRAKADYGQALLPEYKAPQFEKRNERIITTWKGLLQMDRSSRLLQWTFRDHG